MALLLEVGQLSAGVLQLCSRGGLSASGRLVQAWSHDLGNFPGETRSAQVFRDCLIFLLLRKNYHELSTLTQLFISSWFCKSEVQHNMTVCSGHRKAEN